MNAAWRDQEDVVEILLENGSSITIQNNRGATAVDRAAARKRSGIHSLLLEAQGSSRGKGG